MATIIAFDPGGTTGWARVELCRIRMGDFNKWERVREEAENADIIIVERPFLTSKVRPVVFEVAGVCYETAFRKTAELVFQEPSIPNFIETRYELTGKVKGSRHAKDAFCHLTHFMVRYRGWTMDQCLEAII